MAVVPTSCGAIGAGKSVLYAARARIWGGSIALDPDECTWNARDASVTGQRGRDETSRVAIRIACLHSCIHAIPPPPPVEYRSRAPPLSSHRDDRAALHEFKHRFTALEQGAVGRLVHSPSRFSWPANGWRLLSMVLNQMPREHVAPRVPLPAHPTAITEVSRVCERDISAVVGGRQLTLTSPLMSLKVCRLLVCPVTVWPWTWVPVVVHWIRVVVRRCGEMLWMASNSWTCAHASGSGRAVTS